MALTSLVFIGVVSVVLIVWLVLVTDGTYLGSRGVRFIYNRFARVWSLDESDVRMRARIEGNDTLAAWLTAALEGIEEPRVLDVATGTGRVPLLTATLPGFEGHVTGIDISRNMLARGMRIVQSRGLEDRVALVPGDARKIEFADATFDVVTCVEALEMITRPRRALAEMVRVLKPDGKLIVGKATEGFGRLKPGRFLNRRRITAELEKLGVEGLDFDPWGSTDELVIGTKQPARVHTGSGV